MTTYSINKEHNGIEIKFDNKPNQDTLTNLKANGFRWHRVKKLWFAKQTDKRLALASALADGTTAPIKATRQDNINLDNLGGTKTEYGAEFASVVRADLKKRGVKGVTVRCSRSGYTDSITVTIKATEEDFASIEEMKKREAKHSFLRSIDRGLFRPKQGYINYNEYDAMSESEQENLYIEYLTYCVNRCDGFNIYHHERNDYFELTTAFYNKCLAVYKIANQWNYDNSDSMTDYFDVGYYLDIDIKKPENITPRETMTDEERAAYNQEMKEKDEQLKADMERMRKEEEEREKAYKEYEKKREQDFAIINDSLTVEDLPEEERIYITNIAGGCGKEATITELEETLKERKDIQDAVISRRVTFSTREAFDAFTNYFLCDFDFLVGFGGTGSDDVRLKDVEHVYNLNEDQRRSVKFYLINCIGVYVDNELMLVIDPQGYNYARYVYKLTEASKQINALQETEEQRKESEAKPAFYFPAPVEEQKNNITIGQDITIYKSDGWILCNIYAGAGTITAIESGTYAQYKGVYIELSGKKKVFIRDNNPCLIYEGIKDKLPDELTREQLNDHMYHVLNNDELFPRVLKYYEKQGVKPLIDTIQR